MVTRKQFISAAVATSVVTVAAPLLISACTNAAPEEDYADAVKRIWQPPPAPLSEHNALLRELVRHATLAASSHNTQCWKFRLSERLILVEPDLSRRCPAVDPDDHHLYVSLGCATENLVQAALAHGFYADARVEARVEARVDARASSTSSISSTNNINIALTPTKAIVTPLYNAIATRQCTRGVYDGKPVSSEELNLLAQVSAGDGNGVQILLLTDKTVIENIVEYVMTSNTAQMQDAAFVAELKAWIRFSTDEAIRAGDGLYSAASGNPTLPRWLGSRMFDLLFTAKRENEKYAAHIRSSAGIAVFVSDKNDVTHWVEAGRCVARFQLQAAALGIRSAFLNQPVEVASMRPQFAAYLGMADRRPDLVLRFGRGALMPKSLRRQLSAVLV
jgi:hypothetical protein